MQIVHVHAADSCCFSAEFHRKLHSASYSATLAPKENLFVLQKIYIQTVRETLLWLFMPIFQTQLWFILPRTHVLFLSDRHSRRGVTVSLGVCNLLFSLHCICMWGRITRIIRWDMLTEVDYVFHWIYPGHAYLTQIFRFWKKGGANTESTGFARASRTIMEGRERCIKIWLLQNTTLKQLDHY